MTTRVGVDWMEERDDIPPTSMASALMYDHILSTTTESMEVMGLCIVCFNIAVISATLNVISDNKDG